jgi:anti-sigma regulatory factor (Ser/Thr protein kinase)
MTVDTDRIVIDVVDNGAGIQDVELALQEGYSTASEEQREMGFGAGMGLPNIQKNADHLQIESEKGKGTHVTISFRVRNNGE